MREPRVLVVDDEPRYVRLLRANLESSGYQVLAAVDGPSAIKIVEAEEPDLVLLDIMLPGIDGFEVCRRIREFSLVPIIMLTAKGEEADRVRGLDQGADDYLTKPFSAGELLARVRAVLRRSSVRPKEQAQPVFGHGPLKVDFAQRRVEVNGREVRLTPTEYRLLYELATHVGRVMVQEDLLRRVWGKEYQDEGELLRVYIRRLRQKIEEDPANPSLVMTKPGIGYLFAATP
ncbi:MAG: response regulator transcription factor [Chloroflexi bacterium]|nr:response regulator transcription factor [Chloroflexota bacterium]